MTDGATAPSQGGRSVNVSCVERGSPVLTSGERAVAGIAGTGSATSQHLVRAGARLALLMRAVPLLQAVLTLAFGLAVYRRPGLGAFAGCLVLCWSGYLALRAWSGWGDGWDRWNGPGHGPALLCLADAGVTVAAMVVLGAAVPAATVTTSFYWAAPLAQAVILLAGLSVPFRLGGFILALLALTYTAVVAADAGAAALPVAGGNVAGMAAYFALGAVIGRYTRRLGGVLTRAGRQAEEREAQLGVLRARAEEFRRLHDDAVQVLERAAAGEPGSPELRAYASRAAGRLRAAISHHPPTTGSLLGALRGVADTFAALGFAITVAGDPPAHPGERASSLLTAATIEALDNAHKHSGANAAAVQVSGAPEGVVVTVKDHGRGFCPESARCGFGLASSIFRRLEDGGGGAEVTSAPGAGTTVRMWMPC
jgi:signal transduction histidine kinase